MNFSVENRGGQVIFTLKDKQLNAVNAPVLKAQFLIVCQPDIESLILDFSNIEQIDSAGLGALLLAYRILKEYDIPIGLISVRSMVKSMLRISQLEHLFEFFDSVDEAIESLEGEEIEE
ncbi:MAG: STAS domain-containing protein [Candidatus Kapabacteria bacterium]|nr:STAS domain-containing protein [Candidatus Kapabacteria bacterium]